MRILRALVNVMNIENKRKEHVFVWKRMFKNAKYAEYNFDISHIYVYTMHTTHHVDIEMLPVL